MRKKRNMLKRNSGFIVGCFLAAGASFFSADILITEVLPEYGTPVVILPETETVTALAPEKAESKTYETDPFTVTASGNVIKGVEADALKKETETSETENSETENSETESSDTDYTGSQNGQDGTSSESGDGSDSNTTGSQSGSDSSYTESGSGNNDSYSDNNSTGNGSYSDGSSYGESIQIQNPGNGDYYYDNNSGSANGNYSDSSNSSSSDQSGNSNAWTPDDVILSGICSRYIDVSELYSYGPATIRLIRNEIFAVNGRIFKSQDLMDYFCQKSWYVPTYNPEDFDARMLEYLNDYEEANLKLILEYEDWLATQ